MEDCSSGSLKTRSKEENGVKLCELSESDGVMKEKFTV